MKKFLLKTGPRHRSGPLGGKWSIPAVGAASVLILAGLLTACPNEPSPKPSKTEAPAAEAAQTSVAKTQSPDTVVFTLTSAPAGIWKVYSGPEGGVPLENITATYNPETKQLYLIAAGNLAPAVYYVTVTENGKGESDRLKLTVTSQETSAAPQVSASGVLKDAAEQAAVTFTLTNSYAAGTAWKVYAANTGSTLAAGVSAAHSGSALTLTAEDGDIDASDYYVSAVEPGKIESPRLKLTVAGYTAEGQTPAPGFEAASVTKTAAPQAAVIFTLTNSYAAGTQWKVYAANTGDTPAAGISAALEGSALTLTAEDGDIEAGDYYVSAAQDGEAESTRVRLTVVGFTAEGQTVLPTVENPRVTKDAAQPSWVKFTLTNPAEYPAETVWKVYAANTGAELASGISAALDNTFLTLSHTADIPAASYYVSAAAPDKTESNRLHLTVVLPRTPKPQPSAGSAVKTSQPQTTVEFTLTNSYTAGTVWRVYAANTGAELASGISAAYSGSTLTLSHASDVQADSYYVSATESGKTESERTALTVAAQLTTPKPQPSAASASKTSQPQTAVAFTLTNSYTAGTVWRVYAGSTGAGQASGISAALNGSTLTLSHASDVQAGSYYVSATESGKAESDRTELTVTAYVQPVTPTPTAAVTTAAKTTAVQPSVTFTLTSTHTAGTWKVYGSATGGTALTDVNAAFTAPNLTLSAAEDLDDGDYYVRVTETGKRESDSLKLTVEAAPNVTGTPASNETEKYKASKTAVSVSYTLTNTYGAGVTFSVYTAQTGGTPATGISAVISGSALTLSHSTDIPAGDYYVSAQEPGKEASPRRKFTVKGWGSAEIVITFPALDEPAEISGPASIARNAPLNVSAAGEGITVTSWRLDGVVQSGQTGDSITFAANTLNTGRRRIAVFITKNGVPYSQELTVTVTP